MVGQTIKDLGAAQQEEIASKPAEGPPPEATAPTQIDARPLLALVKTVLDDLPEEYDQDSLHEVLRKAVDQIDRKIATVAQGGVRVSEGSLSGSVLAAGSVGPDALDLSSTSGGGLSPFPDQDSTVILRIAPDPTRDRPLSTTISSVTYTGPGRIWRVTGVELPANFKPELGAVRYRILADQMQMGVMSCGWLDAPVEQQQGSKLIMSRWYCEYGIVLVGIPNFLAAPPERVLYSTMPGWGISGLKAVNDSGTNGNISNDRSLYEPRATTVFSTSPVSVYEEMSDSNVAAAGNTYPTTITTTYLDEIEEITFMLVTADDVDEAYAQMNGRPSGDYAMLGGNSLGMAASTRAGIQLDSPCPANVAVDNGPISVTVRTSSDHDGDDKVVEGVPFLYDDLGSMLRTKDTFAMVLRTWPPRVIPQWSGPVVLWTSATNDQRAATWHRSGVSLSTSNRRSVGLDVVVI